MKRPSKQLLQKWDKKLAETGFTDIEDRASGRLKKSCGTISIAKSLELSLPFPIVRTLGKPKGYGALVKKQSQAEYYRVASVFLFTKEFKSESYKRIWEAHCEGKSLRGSAKELKLSFRQVRYAVEIMQSEFGLKLAQTDNSEATKGSNHAKDDSDSAG